MYHYWMAVWTVLKTRWALLRREPEAGYTTETVVVTAALVVVALAIIAVLVSKVTSKVSGIDLG
jgi:hypothetical protein